MFKEKKKIILIIFIKKRHKKNKTHITCISFPDWKSKDFGMALEGYLSSIRMEGICLQVNYCITLQNPVINTGSIRFNAVRRSFATSLPATTCCCFFCLFVSFSIYFSCFLLQSLLFQKFQERKAKDTFISVTEDNIINTPVEKWNKWFIIKRLWWNF